MLRFSPILLLLAACNPFREGTMNGKVEAKGDIGNWVVEQGTCYSGQREQYFGGALWTKQHFSQTLLRRYDRLRCAFIIGQLPNQIQNHRQVGFSCGPDFEVCHDDGTVAAPLRPPRPSGAKAGRGMPSHHTATGRRRSSTDLLDKRLQ